MAKDPEAGDGKRQHPWNRVALITERLFAALRMTVILALLWALIWPDFPLLAQLILTLGSAGAAVVLLAPALDANHAWVERQTRKPGPTMAAISILAIAVTTTIIAYAVFGLALLISAYDSKDRAPQIETPVSTPDSPG